VSCTIIVDECINGLEIRGYAVCRESICVIMMFYYSVGALELFDNSHFQCLARYLWQF
jgi:hypothetical protein